MEWVKLYQNCIWLGGKIWTYLADSNDSQLNLEKKRMIVKNYKMLVLADYGMSRIILKFNQVKTKFTYLAFPDDVWLKWWNN